MKHTPRDKNEGIVSGFIIFRYFVIGAYVGLATVGIFIYWYTSYDWSEYKHTLINFRELRDWNECNFEEQRWKNFA